jgi:4-hydroxy-tetrahydrodipicolinate synthase
MSATPRFGTVVTAMVTPFLPDGSLDLPGAATLARWLVDQGNSGLVLAGTTGESPAMTDDEKVALFEAVREAVDVPLLAGTTTSDTHHSVALTERALATGVDGILVVCPYYSRPSQAGIEAHVRAVAEAADGLPVAVYDIPVRTGRKIETETLLRLFHEVPNVVALKDAAGNPGETARVVAAAPDGFELYSGDDSMTLPLLAVGAVGVIGVATAWTAPQHVELFRRFADGDVEGARSVNAGMLESFAFETSLEAPNPVPTKAMLRVLGLPAGEPRLPMGPTPDGLEAQAREVAKRLGLLE